MWVWEWEREWECRVEGAGGIVGGGEEGGGGGGGEGEGEEARRWWRRRRERRRRVRRVVRVVMIVVVDIWCGSWVWLGDVVGKGKGRLGGWRGFGREIVRGGVLWRRIALLGFVVGAWFWAEGGLSGSWLNKDSVLC